MAASLQELMGVQGHDTGLIGLGNVGKDDIDHANEHAVALGHTGILDDGDDVGALLGHVQEVTSHAVGELDGVDEAGGPDPVSDMGDGGTGRGAEVEDLLARSDEDVTDTAEDTGGELGAEGIPDTVLDLGALRAVDRDALLAVDGLADGHVAGAEHVLLAAGNKDTLDTMGLDDHLGAGADTTAATTGTATTTAITTKATTAT